MPEDIYFTDLDYGIDFSDEGESASTGVGTGQSIYDAFDAATIGVNDFVIANGREPTWLESWIYGYSDNPTVEEHRETIAGQGEIIDAVESVKEFSFYGLSGVAVAAVAGLAVMLIIKVK